MQYRKVLGEMSVKRLYASSLWVVGMVYILGIFLFTPQLVWAQGGCGSVCIPLESINPERTQIGENNLRFFATSEYGRFDTFREGGSAVTNPGGNEATVFLTTAFIDYGTVEHFTASLMVPFVNKEQMANKFGERVASGIGDLAVFGRYEVIASKQQHGPSLSLGLGLKFPTGSIEEPDDQPRLPPAFQVGSGAYDLVPTISYYQAFSGGAVFGNSFVRLPINDNKFDYRFGREYEVHLGAKYPLPVWDGRLEVLGSVDFLHAEHDTDSGKNLPDRLRDGEQVLNTGGTFVDITPGIRFKFYRDSAVQVRFFIPIIEDWNGLRSSNVGQVATDLTVQFSMTHTLSVR